MCVIDVSNLYIDGHIFIFIIINSNFLGKVEPKLKHTNTSQLYNVKKNKMCMRCKNLIA
jgi:hypothetical protein